MIIIILYRYGGTLEAHTGELQYQTTRKYSRRLIYKIDFIFARRNNDNNNNTNNKNVLTITSFVTKKSRVTRRCFKSRASDSRKKNAITMFGRFADITFFDLFISLRWSRGRTDRAGWLPFPPRFSRNFTLAASFYGIEYLTERIGANETYWRTTIRSKQKNKNHTLIGVYRAAQRKQRRRKNVRKKKNMANIKRLQYLWRTYPRASRVGEWTIIIVSSVRHSI